VIETALQKENVKYADDYFKKYASQMEPNDILRANALLGGELDNTLAYQTAGKVVQGQVNNIITPDADRAFNIALNTESSGKQFGGPGSVAGPDQPTTSTAGAVGIAQVLPSTGPEAAKLAGVPWDEEKFKNDPAYNRALGKAYFEKQLKDNGGSLAKAYASYNAGPGALADAVKAADEQATGPLKPGEVRKSWIDFLPVETQNYVNKNMKVYGAGGGQNEMPTLNDIQNQVRAEIGTDHPKRLKLALVEAERQYDDVVKSKTQTNDKAVADAMRLVLQNGGDYGSLPANVRSRIPVERVDDVMTFAKKIATGDNTTNLALYNELSTHPQKLAALTDDQFFGLRSEFSDTDFKHFSDQRATLLNGSAGSGPGDLNTEAIKSTLDDRLRTMGVYTGSKDDNQVQLGAIRQFVNKRIAAAQIQRGKKMDDAETSQFIDGLFAQSATYAGLFGQSHRPMLGMTVSDISGTVKSKIVAAYTKQGIDDPNDAQILEAYWTLLSNKGSK
jgi:soluble lytic murein transglycosylase